MAKEIDMLQDAEFENQITAMGDDQPALIKFVARQQYATSKILVVHGQRIQTLERKNRRIFGVVGGVSAILAMSATAIVNYFMNR